MPTTTISLKLPEDLKNTMAKVAACEGKTAHALEVDTLQSGMADALERRPFFADGEATYQYTLHSNTVYSCAEVNAYIAARLKGAKAVRPPTQPLDAAKPMAPTRLD